MVTTYYTVSFDNVPNDCKFNSIADITSFAERKYLSDECSSYVICGHDEYSEDDNTPEYGRTYFWKCGFRK